MRRTLALAVFLAVSLCPLSVRAQDVPAGRARVKITGSGNNVVLERQAAPQRSEPRSSVFAEAAPPSPPPPPSPSPIDLAARMKASGASDAAVISYLKSRDDLPTIIDSADVRRLRKAGAGQVVIGWLSRVSALDIGETGEGHEAPEYAPPAPAMDYGAQVYDAGYSVPYFYGNGYYAAGGYGGYGGVRSHRFGRFVHPGGHPVLRPGGQVPRPTPHTARIGGAPARRLLP